MGSGHNRPFTSFRLAELGSNSARVDRKGVLDVIRQGCALNKRHALDTVGHGNNFRDFGCTLKLTLTIYY